MDLGDVSLLLGDDEIVNNLIKNIKFEEERFADLVLANSELAVKEKMTNYMARQIDKFEETLFKVKQKESEQALSSLKSNKETVKCGYTEKMKELVDRGLRSSSPIPK
jgi:hypothetical protein